MKTVVLIIAERVFRDEEYLIPKENLIRAGFRVITASTSTDWAEGKLGARVKPEMLLSEIKPENIDALAFIGGGGAAQYFDDPLAHRLAEEVLVSGKPVAAICIAPVILARGGLLRGKKATVYKDGADDLRKNGAEYTGAMVERDGLILTANGPEAAEEFSRRLIEVLNERNPTPHETMSAL